jgi:hypothetical protein
LGNFPQSFTSTVTKLGDHDQISGLDGIGLGLWRWALF